MSDPIDLQYLRDSVGAVMGGKPMAEDTYEGLLAALAEVERLRAEQRLDLADVDRFRAMARGYMDERDDARLALAMARGEGWPEGWQWRPEFDQWLSPCKGFAIVECQASDKSWWQLAALYPSQTVNVPESIRHHLDPLSALRAYQAMVTP